MNPQQLAEFNEMKRRLTALERAENVPFVENLKRRIDIAGDVQLAINNTNLTDLKNVNAPTPSSGQVLEWNGTAWVNATDNT